MSWLQPQILRHFTALRPERKKWWSFFQVVWVIRNIEHLPVIFGGSEILNPLYCLGDQNFWILSCVLGDQKFWITCIVWGIRNSESPELFGDQKFWILPCVVWGVRNSKSSVFFGDQNFWILSCVLGGSETLNLLCCLGDQKFRILSCVLGGSEILNPLLCCGGGGGAEILNLWVFACVPWRSKVRIFVRFLWGTSRDKKFQKSFSCLNLK